MRYIFLCLIFCTTTCLGQKSKGHSKSKTDTATQVNPTKTDTAKQAKPDTAKAVTYQSTQSQTSKKIYINDTTFFAVHVIANGYETILLGNEKTISSDKELDNFITSNQLVIHSKKIFIITSPQAPFETIKPLLDILREHQFFEFQIVRE